MENKIAFACVFIAAIGSSIYIGYRYKSFVATAMVGPKNDNIDDEQEPTSVCDVGTQKDVLSTDVAVQTSPKAIDQSHIDDPQEYETVTTKDIHPEEYDISQNTWMERFWRG